MYNIPLTLFLGKTLNEYQDQLNNRADLLAKINQAFPCDQLKGHKPECQLRPTSRLGYHGSYTRSRIIDTEGRCHQAQIPRVKCGDCGQTWTVYPSILIARKHYDAVTVQNTLEQVLSHELTYRGTVRQHHQLCSTGTTKPNQFVSPYTPWNWVMWLGRFSLPLVLLACGLMPPHYVVEDEKFVRQNRLETYLLGLVDQRTNLIWWLDYLWHTAQTSIQNSLQNFVDEIWLAVGLNHTFKGATTDGWPVAKAAFAALNSHTLVAECLLHPFLKFKLALYRWAKETKAGPEWVAELGQKFWRVLFAADKPTFEAGLAALQTRSEFNHPLLAERLASLKRKQAGLSLHFEDEHLALTSNAIDRRFQRLERKFRSMQQFRTEQSGYWTVTAWGIVQNFRRYGAQARQPGRSPVELAGVDLQGLPWLQFILIKVAQLHWLKDPLLRSVAQS